MAMGVFFIFFRLKIAKGAAEFYRKAYTEKNLKVIFLIVGIVLALVGAFLILQYTILI